ncbi:RNA polymerase Rpb3/Rpb11 dimerization domain containing protein [Trichomonas vaginalis G3]|uniref:RNA polymerase Rpb3/Rpb11 dimerisation domain containing protein n=1 Tax=Trichomonas vaginalis (strain ATCC PRA-98 / G3) TaxID=412133 RepID=A2DQ63_TRIV3|nr:RNA polymerase II protein [Trichomonas vaginalis G3]EAY17490.1 RNA polymerase Rpb3/Rpb11 dimerization domain containing protein [Trichomonas vaginalis G3]KAI5533596.1 RNA polymerase II protein [Trichomonas vaginalis G3]|eukprot:XP_001329625.1 RNA polymerase Rpb3/Rpb11 dimerisation domain containing protein [Trichomonas vaginalis G3]
MAYDPSMGGQNQIPGYEEEIPKLVTVVKEEKSDNCYTFTVQKEDHTLGNLLTDQLLTENRILFAGYRIEHPTKDLIKIRVKASQNVNHPKELIDPAIEALKTKIAGLQSSFISSCQSFDKRSQN